MATVVLGLLQHACGADPADNLGKALRMAAGAADRGAQVICTQELFRSPYFCQSEDYAAFGLAEPVPGPVTEAFGRFARERGVVVVASVFDKMMAAMRRAGAVELNAKQVHSLTAAAITSPRSRQRSWLLKQISNN